MFRVQQAHLRVKPKKIMKFNRLNNYKVNQFEERFKTEREHVWRKIDSQWIDCRPFPTLSKIALK